MKSARRDDGWQDREIVRLGRALVHHFFVLHKTARNYGRGHPAMGQPVAELLKAAREIHRRREEASLTLSAGHILCSEVRLKPDAAGFEAFIHVARAMRSLEIGTIHFTTGLQAAELDEAVHLLIEVQQKDVKNPFHSLLQLMERHRIKGVEVEGLPEEGDRGKSTEGDAKERAKVIYSRTLDVISDVMADVKIGKTLKMRKSKRLVMSLVDSLLTAETNLLGLTTIRCHDEYTYNHSVNVGVLSLALGQRMGLHKRNLVELGMAAIFHDIGKSCIPLQILNKPSSFTAEEWQVMKRHPVFGVKELLRLKGVDALTARIMMGAFEHHLNYDLSGYPEVPYGKGVSLFGRIISIADCYDAYSSSRVYSRKAEPPDKTLQFMLDRSGVSYDPLLMKLFVNCIGVYPVGTLCLLSSGELAVVLQSNPDPDKWSAPRVKIISDAAGMEIDGETADLADPREERTLDRTVDAEKYGVDVARFFL